MRLFFYSVNKIFALLLSLTFVLLLTKFPSYDAQITFSSAYLSVSSIVSLWMNLFFLSNFIEDVENGKSKTKFGLATYVLFNIQVWFLFSLIFGVSSKYVVFVVSLGVIQSINQYFDAKILVLDRFSNERAVLYEVIRLLLRILSIFYVYLILAILIDYEYKFDGVKYILIISVFCFTVIFSKDFKKIYFIKFTKYKYSVFFGNLFWIAPRLVFHNLGKEVDVLHYSYLQSLGTGVQQCITLFYGRLLNSLKVGCEGAESKFKSNLRYFYILIFLGFLLQILFENSALKDFAIIVLFAVSVFIQSISRATLVSVIGNNIASEQYLKSLVIGFPLVIFVSYFFDAEFVVFVLVFTQFIRTVMYEKNTFVK